MKLTKILAGFAQLLFLHIVNGVQFKKPIIRSLAGALLAQRKPTERIPSMVNVSILPRLILESALGILAVKGDVVLQMLL